MLFYKKQEAARAEALRNFVTGRSRRPRDGRQLGYIPLPEAVVDKVSAAARNRLRTGPGGLPPGLQPGRFMP